ncbi:autophagy-related protein 13-domain-containing protein [Sporodiniella umbellata]|nr:autophagy-related protein 13-domain-containing protein [Sporodiniella umbellata]
MNQPGILSESHLLSNKHRKDQQKAFQHFYSKTAQIILQARITIPKVDKREPDGVEEKSKLFSIETEGIELLRDDLKSWKTISDIENMPPMVISIYLDTSRLPPSQILLGTHNSNRWDPVDSTNAERFVLEKWTLGLRQSSLPYTNELSSSYKHSAVFFRSLYSFVRLMPAFNLCRILSDSKKQGMLSIGYHLSDIHCDSEIPITSNLMEHGSNESNETFEFSDLITPNGTLSLSVVYRRYSNFRLEDKTFAETNQQIPCINKRWTSPNCATAVPEAKSQLKSCDVSLFKSPSLSSSSSTESSSHIEARTRSLTIKPSFGKYKSANLSLNRPKTKDLKGILTEETLRESLQDLLPKEGPLFQKTSNRSEASVHKKTISYFQSLKNTHCSFSESLSSNIVNIQEGSNSSSHSSINRFYQPAIPSPLHTEQTPFYEEKNYKRSDDSVKHF